MCVLLEGLYLLLEPDLRTTRSLAVPCIAALYCYWQCFFDSNAGTCVPVGVIRFGYMFYPNCNSPTLCLVMIEMMILFMLVYIEQGVSFLRPGRCAARRVRGKLIKHNPPSFICDCPWRFKANIWLGALYLPYCITACIPSGLHWYSRRLVAACSVLISGMKLFVLLTCVQRSACWCTAAPVM